MSYKDHDVFFPNFKFIPFSPKLGLTIHIYGTKYFIIFYYNILTIFSSYAHKQVNVK